MIVGLRERRKTRCRVEPEAEMSDNTHPALAVTSGSKPMSTEQTNTDTVIRAAAPADADALTAISLASKKYWGYPDELMEIWRNFLTVTPGTIAENLVYVAQTGPGGGTNEEIAGYYSLTGGAQRHRELHALFIQPKYIGRGVGTELFRHARWRARSLDSKLLVIASDPNAEGFYLRQGARRLQMVETQPPGRKIPLLGLVL